MGLSTLIPSLIFGLVGLFIIVYTLKLMLSAIIGNPLNWLEQQKFLKKERLLYAGDQHFQKNISDSAVQCWKDAFYLDRINYLLSSVEKVHSHNINVLSRFLNLAEKRSSHIPNLALIEELFAERTELMNAFLDTKLSLKKIRNKKKGASSKPVPDWALIEFSKKESEIKSKIDQNRQVLEKELVKLFDSQNNQQNQGITYH